MAESESDAGETAPPAVRDVFAARVWVAEQYVARLRTEGIARGLIGPREADRVWDRHVLNSAVIEELVPGGARVVDVGTGAGLPGVPLAIARPDLDIVLLEPMARRVEWLREVSRELRLSVSIIRGRAEDAPIRDEIGGADVVTARAVAPLGKLSGWCLPLVRQGGSFLAMKGLSAADEVERDRSVMREHGARDVEVVTCGSLRIADPATVVSMRRGAPAGAGSRQARRTGGTRTKRRRK